MPRAHFCPGCDEARGTTRSRCTNVQKLTALREATDADPKLCTERERLKERKQIEARPAGRGQDPPFKMGEEKKRQGMQRLTYNEKGSFVSLRAGEKS